jgi:hypothetical protein
MKLALERGQVDLQMRLEAKDGKIIASRRRLNLAAVRTEQGRVVVADGA